jgi:hypothetical protein
MAEKTYTARQKRRILAALQADADRRGGEPDFRVMAGELEPSRPTLTRWWREAKAAGKATDGEADEDAEVTDAERSLVDWLFDHDDDEDVVRRLAERGLAMVRDARAKDSWTAAARIEAEVRTLVIEHRAQRHGRRDDGPKTPDEMIAFVSQMPEIVLACWLADPTLWDDPRWLQARDAHTY